MTNLGRLFLLLAIVLLPLTATVPPVYATPVIDQVSPHTVEAFNGPGIFQQGIRSGMAGQLVGIDIWCQNTGAVSLGIWLGGPPWRTGSVSYGVSGACTVAHAWKYFDLSPGELELVTGEYFTLGLQGPDVLFGVNSNLYPYGSMYYNGFNYTTRDLAFRTYMEPAPSDIQIDAFGTGNGRDLVQVAYTLTNMGGTAFELGFYRSVDALFDPGDEWLSTYSVTDSAALSDGSHILALALGTDIHLVDHAPAVRDIEIAAGRSPAGEIEGEYYLLVVADPMNALGELERTNNDAPFNGVYQYPEPPRAVFVFGTVDDDKVVISANGDVYLNGDLWGHMDASAYRVRTYAGQDRVEFDLGLSDVGAYAHLGEGEDIILPGMGSSTFEGGPGTDVLDFQNMPAGVLADLAAGYAVWEGGNCTSAGMENLAGSEFADVLNGNAEPNTISGRGGDDTLSGFEGDDLLFGGRGQDALLGGDGNDVLYAYDDRCVDDGAADLLCGAGDLDIGYGILMADTFDPSTEGVMACR